MGDLPISVDEVAAMQKALQELSPAERLDLLKRLSMPPETKAERMARGRAALDSPHRFDFTPEQWKDAAENPDYTRQRGIYRLPDIHAS